VIQPGASVVLVGTALVRTAVRPWLKTTLAIIPAVLLVAATLRSIVPPRTMTQVVPSAATNELGPVLGILALGMIAVVWAATRTAPATRLVLVALLLASAMWDLRPAFQAGAVARDAARQIDAIAPTQGGGSLASSRFGVLDLVRPLATDGVTSRAIDYAASDGTPLRMLLFRGAMSGARPTLVVVYGGGWRNGSADQTENISRHFAHLGYTVAAIDYRHAPAHPYPAQIDDVRRSLALLRDSASAWGIDPARMALIGRSSGGHLALLAAYAPDSGADHAMPAPPPIKAVVGYYSPWNLVRGYRELPSPDPIDARHVLRDFLGGSPDDVPARYGAASPATYVRPGLPPTLLLHGSRDHLVKIEFGRSAAAALRTAGVPVAFVELPWADHAFDFVPGGAGTRVAVTVMADFLDRTLHAP
jgi:acetyl esterase/lipase